MNSGNNKKPMTVSAVADYCQVTHRTVQLWIASGALKSYRTPGKHNRINEEDFIEFLKKHQMPVPSTLAANVNSRPRILIVEDDRGVAATLKRIFMIDGMYEVRVAYDGFSAGSIFATYKPDLITLDIRMPGMDGFEVCKQIREKDKRVKIVVVSATLNAEIERKLKQLGADDFILKPFDRKQLLSLVNKWLRINTNGRGDRK